MKTLCKYKDKTNMVVVSITMISILLSMSLLMYIVYCSIIKIYTSNVVDVDNYTRFCGSISKICGNTDTYSITLKYKDMSWVYTNADFEINTNIHTILDSKYMHKLNTIDHDTTIHTIDNLTDKHYDSKKILNYIFIGLDSHIQDIVSSIEYDYVDSTIAFTPTKARLFDITDSHNGLKVDTTTLYDTILHKFMENKDIVVDIPTISTTPNITHEYNKSLTHKISSYTTNVSDSTGGRKQNVKLALSKINGLKVAPNETISFNKITGPHTADAGYQPAIVILNGEYVEDIGGGICQASTTLYNALLTAGVKINEVRKHSIPVKYVPLALDAMVSEGSDLRFTNVSKYPIYIHTYTDSDTATVDIYSHILDDGITYKTRSETIDTISPDSDTIVPDTELKYTNKVLYKGEYYRLKPARTGYEAIGYLDKYQYGKLIETYKIRHEIYKPQTGVVVEGIAEPIENMTVIDNGVEVKI